MDPIPTHILKDKMVLKSVLPFLTKMVNKSLTSGVMPDGLKSALVFPHLKKPSLNPDTLSNYRPVSNLQFLGKIIEKSVATQLCQHISRYNLGDSLQSAYKEAHSTETALLKVKRDCDNALNSGKAVFLILLDLSAAFDTIDHGILIDRLRTIVGVEGRALDWLHSYVTGRSQKVVVNNSCSKSVPLQVGVPQGSVLGPLLFLIYIIPLSNLIKKHGLSHHGYADDTQIYIEFDPKTKDSLKNALHKIESCIEDIRKWMILNKLKLNDDKTEAIIFASPRNLIKIKELHPTIKIGTADIYPRDSVRNLGVIMDSTITMQSHIKAITKSMYFHMRTIRHIRHYLDDDTCKKAINALVTSRLDYANALLVGISESGLHRLQVAQNCAARIITGTKPSAHITQVIFELHWLPVHQRIKFKALCIIYNLLHKKAMPSYLKSLISQQKPSRTLRSTSSGVKLPVQRTINKYGDKRFDTWASKHWNDLKPHILELPTLHAFKRALKTVLFKQHFSDYMDYNTIVIHF